MTIIIYSQIGSSYPLTVQLYDSSTDSPIDVTGASGISASAFNPETGTTVNFTSASIDVASNGTFTLNRSANSFTEQGVYDVKLTYTDSAGNIQIYPRRAGDLKLSVGT